VGLVLNHPAAELMVRRRAEALIQRLEETLGPQALAERLAQGRRMKLAEALAALTI